MIPSRRCGSTPWLCLSAGQLPLQTSLDENVVSRRPTAFRAFHKASFEPCTRVDEPWHPGYHYHGVQIIRVQHCVRVFRNPFLSRALKILSVLLFQLSKSGGKIKNAYNCNNHLIVHLPDPPTRHAGVVERVAACCCLEEDTVVAVVASLLAVLIILNFVIAFLKRIHFVLLQSLEFWRLGTLIII